MEIQAEHGEQPPVSPLEQYQEAMRAGDAEALFASLKAVNQELIGTDRASVFDSRGARHLQFKSELGSFLEQIKRASGGSLKIYLADGGMSRVIAGSEREAQELRGYLDLSYYNSSDVVKAKWEALLERHGMEKTSPDQQLRYEFVL